MNDATPLEIDALRFRRVMGRFATGVTVITARDGEGMRGMTANAFMSGSLDPPLCVVSVAKRAHMHALMLEVGHFGVNILAEDQVQVSEHFAGRPNPALQVEFERRGEVLLLANACARIGSAIVARHDCGDHTLFVGHIFHMDSDGRLPLVYHSGRYCTLGGEQLDHDVDMPEFW